MEDLGVYLPQDRRRALARGEALPEQATGSVLFADISGFTPLTEALDRSLGARRGGEELIRIVDVMNELLITDVERFGGSVIGFAGDAVTCWFDDVDFGEAHGSSESAARRATRCGLALVTRTSGPADGQLTLKVAIATGPARRLVVGDPQVQLIDTLVGATLDRAVAGEQLAAPGEVLADAATLAAWDASDVPGDSGPLVESWRVDRATGVRYAALTGPLPVPRPPVAAFDDDGGVLAAPPLGPPQLRPWILPAVYERHDAGLGDFLTELRPVVVLFLRFDGIDFTQPGSAEDLDRFVRTVQGTLRRTDGTLIDLTIGDKGSYLYAAFGAPAAHEDDPRRAARAALEWVAATASGAAHAGLAVQVGISRSILRVGAHGGRTRRAYGGMGNEVNVAARLMSRAARGQILVSGRIVQALRNDFHLDALPALTLKGMAEPMAVSGLLAERSQHLAEPAPTLPVLGRATELAVLTAALQTSVSGRGQVVGIVADAGVGKSRLLAEVAALAQARGLRVVRAQCESAGVNTSYLLWRPIWQALLGVDPESPVAAQVRALRAAVGRWAPGRPGAAELFGPLVGLALPETPFTAGLNPETRKSALEAVVLECQQGVAAGAAAEPGGGLLIILDDLQWIDPESHDLLTRAAAASADLPVCYLLAYRPPSRSRIQAPRVENLANFTRLALGPLAAEDATRAVHAKLAQLVPGRAAAVAPELVARIVAHAEGNPFYIEELLNYLHDRGLDPDDAAAVAALDLPSSLQSVVLARVDQLSPRQQAEIRVASVIGRLFPFPWLQVLDPTGSTAEVLKADLDELALLDLTPVHTPEPELSHLFRHAVTREVAYESLPSPARAALHGRLADALVATHGEDLDLLAHHYGLSGDVVNKRKYLHAAGTAAAARFANVAALDYLTRALELVPAGADRERHDLLAERAAVFGVQADYRGEAADLDAALDLTPGLVGPELAAAALLVRRSRNAFSTDDHAGAAAAAGRALAVARELGLGDLEAESLMLAGRLARQAADFPRARQLMEQSLAAGGNQAVRTLCVTELAIMADIQGQHARARELFEQALAGHRAGGNRVGEGGALMNLGVALWRAGDLDGALDLYNQAMRVAREVGDRSTEMMALGNAGTIASDQRDFALSDDFLGRSLALSRTLGSGYTEARVLNMLGLSRLLRGDYSRAQAELEQSRQIAVRTGDRQHEVSTLLNLARTARAVGEFARADELAQQGIRLAREIGELELALLRHRLAAAHHRGDDAACTLLMTEMIGLVEDEAQDDRGPAYLDLALVRIARGDDEGADSALTRAVDLFIADGRDDLAAEPRTHLARLELQRGAVDAARAAVARLRTGSATVVTYTFQDPFLAAFVWWEVLEAAGDADAPGVLAAASRELRERAAAIDDPGMRASFLHAVAHHRELLAAV